MRLIIKGEDIWIHILKCNRCFKRVLFPAPKIKCDLKIHVWNVTLKVWGQLHTLLNEATSESNWHCEQKLIETKKQKKKQKRNGGVAEGTSDINLRRYKRHIFCNNINIFLTIEVTCVHYRKNKWEKEGN